MDQGQNQITEHANYMQGSEHTLFFVFTIFCSLLVLLALLLVLLVVVVLLLLRLLLLKMHPAELVFSLGLTMTSGVKLFHNFSIHGYLY